MGGLLRSEDMQYIQLILNEESSHDVMRELGKSEMVHIEDHGIPDRPLYKNHKRKILDCLAWQRQLQDIREVMKQNNITPPDPDVEADKDWLVEGDFLDSIERYFQPKQEDLSTQLRFKAEEIRKINREIERHYVLKFSQNALQGGTDYDDGKGYGTFGTTQGEDIVTQSNESDLEQGRAQDHFSGSLYGTIPIANQSQFQRMVFRITKGPRNAICKFCPIETGEGNSPINDPKTGQPIAKSMFYIMIVGSELPRRIKKMCGIFDVVLYEIPLTKKDIQAELNSSRKKKLEMDDVLTKTNQRIKSVLMSLVKDENGGCPLVCWEKGLEEELCISEALQKFYVLEEKDAQEKIGSRIASKCWVPKELFSELSQILRKSTCPATITRIRHGGRMPPTYFKTNKFTGTFQGIVDTYGIADYKEANPGLFTIVTFPFLFGVMYGDIFHGSILLLGSLYMICNEKKYLRQAKRGEINEIFGMAFGGRYLVLMMGLFAIFCGSIYNDCASIPTDLFGSRYIRPSDGSVHFIKKTSSPYPWGLDPEWSHKANSLQFVNSFKMKLSVIIGVLQMSFGIILGLTNDVYHEDKLSIMFEFVPRICFMCSTFGYMIFMIIFKTFFDWNADGLEAPNLIQAMIKMFLSPGSTPHPPLYNQSFQKGFQLFLVLVAVVSIPVMLFPKAFIKRAQWRKKYGHGVSDFSINTDSIQHHDEDEHEDDHEGGHDHRTVGKNWTLSDELITTGIHTIEFVLGCVSNTASYLRLWALSLAHAELSEVFWNKMIMQYGLNIFPLGFVGIAIWAASTTGVLLCMDVLECFLHALRLHWVEFQNKFYSGNGYKFKPFTMNNKYRGD